MKFSLERRFAASAGIGLFARMQVRSPLTLPSGSRSC